MYNAMKYSFWFAGNTATKTTIFVIILGFFSGVSAKSQDRSRGPSLEYVLERCADYCVRLEKAAFHFICVQQVTQKTYGQPKKKRSYDYQLIKTNQNFRERRVARGRSLTENPEEKDLKPIFKEVFSYKSVIAPVFFVARKNLDRFLFQFTGYRKVLGKRVLAVQVQRKSDTANKGVLRVVRKGRRSTLEFDRQDRRVAEIWVDPDNYSIIGLRVFPAGLAEYNQIVKNAFENGFAVELEDIHYFGLLREGIRYPTLTRIELKYKRVWRGDQPEWGVSNAKGLPRQDGNSNYVKALPGKVLTYYNSRRTFFVKASFAYQNYRFFKVVTGEPEFFD